MGIQGVGGPAGAFAITDLRCAPGTYNYSDGSKYDGNWLDDMRHGHGECFQKAVWGSDAISFQAQQVISNHLLE